MGSAANLATSLFTDFPFSGEVNFLTTGAVAPGAVLSATAFPRGVAYLAIGAPTSGGDWAIRAAMSEGDLSSWIVAGSFTSKPDPASTRYSSGCPTARRNTSAAIRRRSPRSTDGSRNVGEIYAFDRWTCHPGARARLRRAATRTTTISQRSRPAEPARRVHARSRPQARASARRRAAHDRAGRRGVPRARPRPGPWLPPERTFAPLARRTDAFRVERARFVRARRSSTSSAAPTCSASAASISASTISW